MSSPSARLAAVTGHLDSRDLNRKTGGMHKVVVCRDLGPDAMDILRACDDIEASTDAHAAQITL